jgi:hypothetical protein
MTHPPRHTLTAQLLSLHEHCGWLRTEAEAEAAAERARDWERASAAAGGSFVQLEPNRTAPSSTSTPTSAVRQVEFFCMMALNPFMQIMDTLPQGRLRSQLLAMQVGGRLV